MNDGQGSEMSYLIRLVEQQALELAELRKIVTAAVPQIARYNASAEAQDEQRRVAAAFARCAPPTLRGKK